MPDKPELDYLSLPDAALIGQCDVDRYRASGPGGQKRNKTESAVRLRHRPTGVVVTATESRSQHENRARALRRLRERIALEVRRPVDPTGSGWAPTAELRALFGAAPPRRGPELARGVQALLDLFVATGCSVRDTAAALGVGSAAVSRVLLADPARGQVVNELRRARGMRPLR